MKLVTTYDIHTHAILKDTEVKIFGWVRNRRHSKSGISFIDIYDGSCVKIIQLIINKNIVNYTSEVLSLNIGCSVEIEGVLILSNHKNQTYEIQTKKIKIIGKMDSPKNYPISSKKNTHEHLRNFPHLRSRTNIISVITRIRHFVLYTMHNFLYHHTYYCIPTPIITSLDSEGAGSMFRVSTLDMYNIPKDEDGKINFKKDFFGKESFLTVSGQLTLEAYACSMQKVYTFGPTFRAENSNTTRHLSEFWMLEVETAFYNLQDIEKFASNLIKYIIKAVLKECVFDLEFLYNNFEKNIFNRLEKFLSSEIISINYSDAIKILLNTTYKFDNKIKFGMDLCVEHEKYLVDHYFNSAVIIKNYPKNLKAFYMRLNDDCETVAGMDFLLPNIGEVIGGSEREERKLILKSRILELGLNLNKYSWYIDLRRYGTVPHAGFGLGFERLISYITGIKNVRDVISFPRTINNALC